MGEGLPDGSGTRGGTGGWRRRWAAPAFLAVASPVLAEVLSGNLPPLAFLGALPFLLVAYGVPVLLIRDAWVRLGLGVPGLFVLGLAYGFVNEALFAKTVFLDVGLPIDTFDGYGGSGANWAWSSFIVPWHAMHSVLYPIAFAWWLFPSRRAEPWLSRRASLGLFAMMLALGAAVHAGHDNVDGTVPSFLLSLVLVGGLTALGLRLPRRPPLLQQGPPGRWMAWTGAALAPLLFLMAALSDQRLPTWLLVANVAVVFGAFFLLLRARRGFDAPNFLRIALGNELAFVVLAIAFDAQRGAMDALVAHVALELAFLAGLIRLNRGDPMAEGDPPDAAGGLARRPGEMDHNGQG